MNIIENLARKFILINKRLKRWHNLSQNGEGITFSEEDNTFTLVITNSSGVELPLTGGSGTFLYTLSGLVLIFATVMMYGFRMRRRERRLKNSL